MLKCYILEYTELGVMIIFAKYFDIDKTSVNKQSTYALSI